MMHNACTCQDRLLVFVVYQLVFLIELQLPPPHGWSNHFFFLIHFPFAHFLGIPVTRRPVHFNRKGIVPRAQLHGPSLPPSGEASPSLLDFMAASLTTALFLADTTAGTDPSAAADAVNAAADAASKKGGGFFGFFSDSFESFLKLIDAGLDKAGIPYSYGFSIIVLTVLVKVATYPLSKKQVESTLSMQALQPRVKELQAKYANDAERLQVETAKLYQNSGVNPLAGCLPTLATIPVFIGLYRALSNVADEGLLTEGFFWIPSLAGPTKLNGGLGWLLPQEGGVPPLGWHDTIAYLVLPVLLVISQYLSTKIISPQSNANDPSQQQTQFILKFIPLMIGWFSLNVPSGLTLYWLTNNIITTAQQVYLRNKFKQVEPAGAVTGTGTGTGGTYVKPKPEVPDQPSKPSGKELGARRSSKAVQGDVIDVTPQQSGGGRGEKFRAIKAREAAKKAADQVTASSAASSSASVAVDTAAPQQAASEVVDQESLASTEQPSHEDVENDASQISATTSSSSTPEARKQTTKTPQNGSRGKSSGKKGKKK